MLAGLGVKKGDRVGLLLPNCPQYVIAWYATVRLGAIAVGNNPLYTRRELTHQIKDFSSERDGGAGSALSEPRPIQDEAGFTEVVVTELTGLPEVPAEPLGADQVPQGGQTRGQALAARAQGRRSAGGAI